MASSSAGNATFISTGRTRLLIDAGISAKAVFDRLAELGEDPGRLDAVLVTHEHSDHVAGLNTLARRFEKDAKIKRRLPVYTTHLTSATLPWEKCEPDVRTFQAGACFNVGEIEVRSFTTPHDAADPVGFCFEVGNLKAGLVTDLGYIPDSVKFHLRGSEFLILESNHDIEMLKVGPYPWQVKQRVMSRKGHLSNDVVSEFIAEELTGDTRTLVLGHLSEHNNHPEIVRVTALQAVARRGLATEVAVADLRGPTLFEVR